MVNRRTGFQVDPNTAFTNVPYDAQYEKLFLALIAGLAAFGLKPRAVLQIPGSERRLDRILRLIGRCRYSFHDLSRVELEAKHPRTPRFNMPFELGLAVAWAQHGNRRHKWYLLESQKYRLAKSLSDLDGTQVYVHGGTPTGVLRQLKNALARTSHEPTVRQLKTVYRDVSSAARQKKRAHATSDLFDTRPFLDLVYAASTSARQRIAL